MTLVSPGLGYSAIMDMDCSLNRIFFRDGLSLKASGSNNGQTLPRAISTGTHGSAFKFGATQDFVVGTQLITGSSKQVYLESAEVRKVFTNAFLKSVGLAN